MSIYSTLSFDAPVMLYATFHQARKGVAANDYINTMKDLHRLLHEQSEEVQRLWKETLNTTMSHTVTKLRRSLSQFLTTPLKSDEDEIERGLSEQLGDFVNQTLHNAPLGLLTSTEARIVVDGEETDLPKKMATKGKSYLKELSFHLGKSSPPIFESNFFVHGAANLDIIEHMVRDRIGIYTPVHGKHIKEFEGYSYALYNLIHLHGELKQGEERYEAALFFSKGETRYAPFRNGMVELINRLTQSHSISHASLWQRKLGLGVGREFVFRVRGNDVPSIAKVLSDLDFKEKPFVTDALKRGHTLIKEFLF